MKATIKLVAAAGIAGLSLAACGTSHSSAVNNSTSATSSGPTTTVPANAPVGFNAAKTAFVLPYKLGLLPAAELALAKSDATYAKGMANPTYWMEANSGGPSSSSSQSSAPGSGWQYVGAPASPTAVGVMALKSDTISFFYPYFSRLFPGSRTSYSAPVSINVNSLNLLENGSGGGSGKNTPSGGVLVYPTALELQAAPIGTLTIGGTSTSALCAPSSVAYLINNKPINVKGLGFTMTAGPSTIFAGKNVYSNPPTSTPPSLYDKGAASCTAFH